MAKDNIIELVASLDEKDSIAQLNKDIDKVQKKLNKIIVNAKLEKKVEKDIKALIQSLNQLHTITSAVQNQQLSIKPNGAGIGAVIERLDALDKKIDEIKQNPLKVDTAEADSNIKTVGKDLDAVKTNADNAGYSIKQMLSNIGINLSTYQAFRLLKQAIQEVSDAVDDYNKYHTNLRIITGEPNNIVDDMLSGYTEESIKLGIDIDQYESAAEAILRTGKTAAETNMILKDSAVLSKTGFIDSEKAANNLITIANAYDLEADAIENVVDKILSLDVASQTEGGALSTAVARTAKNAQLAGVTIDSLAAQIANLRDVTGKEEEQIATSLNSIYSRMYNVKLGKFLIEDESGIEDITEDISDMETILNRVDIKLRDSKGTFRDFDSIIRDLHDNWSSFNEVEKSAIGKTIGGTYHRNVALAMIQDYEDFQHLQDVAMQSAGTAAERYEAYTESIAAKSAQLNTALKQMWANTISSDLVVDVKAATTEVVQFIDKYEVLQNLMKSAIIYGAAKGFIYLGGTVKDVYGNFKMLAQAFNAMSTLGKTASGTAAYQGALSSLMTYCEGLSDAQIKLLFSTQQLTEAEMIQILQVRGLSAEQASATLATMGLVTAEGTATTATFTLTGAFKALSAAIAANPIGALATLIMGVLSIFSAVKRKAEEAEQAAKELQQRVEQNITQYKSEAKSLDELVSKYAELSNSSTDAETAREELAKMQQELIDNYGVEADSIDLVNGKYSEQIQKLYEVQRVRAETFINAQENIDAYNQALEKLNKAGNINGSMDFEIAFNGGIPQDVIDKWKEDKLIIDSLQYSMSRNDYAFDIDNGNDLETMANTLDTMAESYKDLTTASGDFNREQYTAIKQQAIAAREQLEQSKAVVDFFEKNRVVAEFELSSSAQAQFDKLIDRAAELNKILNSDATAGAKYSAGEELARLKAQLAEIAAENPELLDIINSTFESFKTGAGVAVESIGDIRAAWFENLDEMTKDTFKSADAIAEALQKITGGEGLSHEEFWNLQKLDTDRILGMPKMEGGQFYFDKDNIIAFKDSYIMAQMQMLQADQDRNQSMLRGLEDERKALEEELDLQRQIVSGSSEPEKISAARDKIKQINVMLADNASNQAKYNEAVTNTNILMNEWRSKLGDTVDKTKLLASLQKQVEEAQKRADEAEKAMTSSIDNRIRTLNDEKTALDDEKQALNDQLNLLEEKRKGLEDTIEQYKSIVDVVKDISDAEIEALEARQEAEEGAVQSRIDALKEEKDQKEEQTSIDEKQLELRKKLAELDKAKSTKVRTYSAARGWHFDIDAEAVANAQTAADDAQKAYDKAVTDRDYNEQIKALEEQKKAISENYDTQIKLQKKYYQQWVDIVGEQSKIEDEQLAEQILGSEWREKIKDKDVSLLGEYKSGLSQYNNQLNSLVTNEINTLKNSIKAKDEEIKATEKQIKTMQRYKSQVESAINGIKSKYDGYLNNLDSIANRENTSYAEREQALSDFRNNYEGYISEIANLQSRIQDINAGIYVQTNIPQISAEMATFIDSYRSAIEAMQRSLEESLTGYGVVNSAWDARLAAAANALRRGYAQGGVIDFTGIAAVHGSKTSSETAFSAAQSKDLYDMVRTGEFSAQVANRALEGVSSALNKMPASNNNSMIINVHQELNNVPNPQEFTNQFNQSIEQYWKLKLTESRVH